MPATIIPKITDAGLAAAIDAQTSSLQLQITHIALGTGAYDSEAVGAGMTAMVARKEEVTIGAGSVSGTGAMRIQAIFDSWTGTPSTYDARELGFWAGDPDAGGVLFAVFSHPTDIIVTRNLLDYIASFTLQLTRVPIGSVTVTVDVGAAEALALIDLHEQASDPHQQYLKKAGDTATGAIKGLTSAVGDNSTNFATTAFVKRQGVNLPANGLQGIATTPYAVLTANRGRCHEVGVVGVVNLPDASGLVTGDSYLFRVVADSTTIAAAAGDTISLETGSSVTAMIAVKGETFVLTRNGDTDWRVTFTSSRMPAGIVIPLLGAAIPGSIKANGALLSRTAYPRLYKYALDSGLMVSDADWAAQKLYGRFSTGTSGSNFRIPDLRAMTLRGYDDGRGVDTGRVLGSFQEQANMAHTHGLTDPGHVHVLNDPGHIHAINDPGHVHAASSASAGSHAHTATSDSAGSHSHATTTETTGAHTHTASTGAAGSHQHAVTAYEPDDSAPNVWYLGGDAGGDQNGQVLTAAAGDHTHTVAVNSAGAHDHDVTVTAGGAHTHGIDVVAGGAHTHGVTVNSNNTGIGVSTHTAGITMNSRTTGATVDSQGSETRMKNVALTYYITY